MTRHWDVTPAALAHTLFRLRTIEVGPMQAIVFIRPASRHG